MANAPRPAPRPRAGTAKGGLGQALDRIVQVAGWMKDLLFASLPEARNLHSPAFRTICVFAQAVYGCQVLMAVLVVILIAISIFRQQDYAPLFALLPWAVGVAAISFVVALAAAWRDENKYPSPARLPDPPRPLCTPNRKQVRDSMAAAQARIGAVEGRLDSLRRFSKTLADKDGNADEASKELKKCKTSVTQANDAISEIGPTLGVCHFYERP